MQLRTYYVYVLTNFNNTALYIGVTNNLARRLFEYKSGSDQSFTAKYKLTKLVYYEKLDTAEQAIAREKQLKNWHRAWKIDLIEKYNPEWNDIAAAWQ